MSKFPVFWLCFDDGVPACTKLLFVELLTLTLGALIGAEIAALGDLVTILGALVTVGLVVTTVGVLVTVGLVVTTVGVLVTVGLVVTTVGVLVTVGLVVTTVGVLVIFVAFAAALIALSEVVTFVFCATFDKLGKPPFTVELIL
jgi:hypothetical protein